MSKPSRLSDTQWAEIEKKNLEGVPVRQLAREYNIAEGQIRRRITAQVKNIKSVANSIVYAQTELEKLPLTAQITAQTLAYKMRSVSSNLASVADLNAATAHRLSALANQQVNLIDDTKPLENMELLKGISALTNMSNESTKAGIELLKVNKEVSKQDETAKNLKVISDDELYAIATGG